MSESGEFQEFEGALGLGRVSKVGVSCGMLRVWDEET
jgi:hypothetical protein